MTRFRFLTSLIWVLIVVLAAVGTAAAQPGVNYLSVSGECDDGSVSIHASVQAGAGIEQPWEGWVVARTTVGYCSEWVTVSAIQALPDSGQVRRVDVIDVVESDQAYRYGIRIVTLEHETIDPPASVFFWPDARQEYVTCGEAPVVRGRLEDGGWVVYIEQCPDGCWSPVMLVDREELGPYQGFIGSGFVFDLFGDVFCGGIEGCGIDVQDIRIVDSCSNPVAAEPTTWSTLKAWYR